MDETNNLKLPYIMPSQAQKHVTHNEALAILDAIVQLAVLDRDLTAPPGGAGEGDRYVVAAGASGDWQGQDDRLAVFQDGAWAFLEPRPGWRVWVIDEEELVFWDGVAWAKVSAAIDALQGLALLGVGTDADAVNPFAAKLNKALWTARYAAEGGDGDLRYTLNKEAAGKTLSLLLQSNWSGRAEIGLVGNDDLSFRVSEDGGDWNDALVADRRTGSVRFPGGVEHAVTGAPQRGLLFTPGSDGEVSIWRIDASHAQNPRTATIDSVSGDTITLTSADADQFFDDARMNGVAYLRVWNTSKTAPGEPAWVQARPTGSTLEVTDAADIAGWANGETLQVGDPATMTPGRVIALDISPMLQNRLGAVFRQAGVMVKASIAGTADDALALTHDGSSGSFVGCAANDAGDGTTIVPCTEPSPISESNLVFLREKIAASATVEIVSVLGVFV